MTQSISYSVNSPDERSPEDIHAYMRGLSQDGESFYENEKAVNKWTLQTYWDTLCREMNPNEWIGISTPQVVNAFNLLSKNNVKKNNKQYKKIFLISWRFFNRLLSV